MGIQAINRMSTTDPATLAQTRATRASKTDQPTANTSSAKPARLAGVLSAAGGGNPAVRAAAFGDKPAAASGSSKSSASKTKNYDARDANQDGVVSPGEELQYELQQLDKQTSSQSSGAASQQQQSAIAAYQQSGQSYSQETSKLISAA